MDTNNHVFAVFFSCQTTNNDENELQMNEMTANEEKDFRLISEYHDIFPNSKPENLSWNKFIAARRNKIKLKDSSTVPDSIVKFIVQKSYNHSVEKANEAELLHRQSMSAENIVGNLLERYLSEKLKAIGWVWCSGDCVRSVDFIKKQNDETWIALQIKNRDNSENSSSSAIRDGTNIIKWFRSFSRRYATNWESFPDVEAKRVVSEEDFKNFVSNYLSK